MVIALANNNAVVDVVRDGHDGLNIHVFLAAHLQALRALMLVR